MTVIKRLSIALAPMATVAAAIGLWTIWGLVFSTAVIRVNYQGFKYQSVPDDKHEAVTQMFGGDSGIDTVVHAERVEAYRVSDPGRRPRKVNAEDFPVTSGPVAVPADLAGKLASALQSPDSYVWQFVKMCEPEYGVVLSFYRQADRIDVFLCFQCDQMMVVRNGAAVGGEDFDYMRPRLVRVVKLLFPSDIVIQSLTDKGCGLPPRADDEPAQNDETAPEL